MFESLGIELSFYTSWMDVSQLLMASSSLVPRSVDVYVVRRFDVETGQAPLLTRRNLASGEEPNW